MHALKRTIAKKGAAMTGIAVLAIALVLIALDIRKIISFTTGFFMYALMLALPHIAALWYLLFGLDKASGAGTLSLVLDGTALTVFGLYVFIRFHLFPFRKSKVGSLRVRILYGGQMLIRAGMWCMLLQALFYIFFFRHAVAASPVKLPTPLLWTDAVVTVSFLYGILFNGCVRIIFTCRRLGVTRRLVSAMLLWIPGINLFVMRYIRRKAIEEYDFECYRFTVRSERAGTQLCALKYPIIMVHGVGFRDLRYFNYWGRIPRELADNGAIVHYGHQEAWGTIEDNAAFIAEKIKMICNEHNCDKVNIIAHSKGGLDARHMITKLGMGHMVASLTTISTPHRGSQLINLFNRLPDRVYRFIASCYDRAFRKIGDKNPDCYRATKQLAPSFCEQFNRDTPDDPRVYYLSYMSVMTSMRSDSLLAVPYMLMRFLAGRHND